MMEKLPSCVVYARMGCGKQCEVIMPLGYVKLSNKRVLEENKSGTKYSLRTIGPDFTGRVEDL